MSVLINGFNLPKDGCKDCVMVKRGQVYDICPFLKQEVNWNVERGGKPNGCPLIEVSDINVGDKIYRQAAIDELNVGAEFLRRILDDTDVAGPEREKYEWGLGLIESFIYDIKDLPPTQMERKKGEGND